MTRMELVARIARTVHGLSPEQTAASVRAALESGLSPADIMEGISMGMEAVGEDYKRQKAFLPELLLAEQCLRAGLHEIETFVDDRDLHTVEEARQQLAERAASWLPALSSCVTRLLHSSDSFLVSKQK